MNGWDIFFGSAVLANASVMYFSLTHDVPVAAVAALFSTLLCTTSWFFSGKESKPVEVAGKSEEKLP